MLPLGGVNMQNARALDEKLRKIIREVSDSTGQEIKRDLLKELVAIVQENQAKDLKTFLESLNRALRKI